MMWSNFSVGIADALPGHLVLPSFIDAHHRLTQSFGKSLAFGKPSEIFRCTRSDAFRLIDAGDSSCGGGWTWIDHHAGADAVGLGDLTGGIAIGKAADFLIVDTDTPEFPPSWDIDWELVRFGNRDQIVAVMAAGRLRLWRGWPTDWDAHALIREGSALARDSVARASILRVHPVSRDHRSLRPGRHGAKK
jgi:5-methylthioadenosine/S-adenosylhomocysteine deaminase